MVTSPFLDFLKRLLLFSIIPGMIASGLYFILPSKFITPALPFLFAFFIAATLTGYYFLMRSVEKKFIRFLNAYLLYTTVKLILYSTVMIVYIFLHKQDALPFGITFFLLYLCYTIFEVVSLVSYSKRGEEK